MGDGSLNQDEINAILQGTDKITPRENKASDNNEAGNRDEASGEETSKPDNAAMINLKMTAQLMYTSSAVRGLFGDYNVICDVVSVVPYSRGKQEEKHGRRMVFSSLKSLMPGSRKRLFYLIT